MSTLEFRVSGQEDESEMIATWSRSHSYAPGDLIHADRHGAAVIRPEHVDALPDAIDQVMRRESPILEAARRDDFSGERLLDIWSQMQDVR